MRALIDADLLTYELGELVDDDTGEVIPAGLTLHQVDRRIEHIIKESGSSTYQLYLTGKGNFRFDYATILPYKGKRTDKPKPRWYEVIRHHLIHNWKAIVIEGQEADDALSIAQHEDMRGKEEKDYSTIICTRDKDLDMVAGWHYSWAVGKYGKEKTPWLQDETSAIRWMYTQLILGDSVDNILGVYGMGKKSAAVGKLQLVADELGMSRIVFKIYKDRFGSYAEKFMTENGILLWMRREEGEIWKPPVGFDIEGSTE